MLYVDQHGSFFNAVDENPIGVDDNCISIQGYLLKLTILSNDRDLGHLVFFFYIIIEITISSIVIGLKKFDIGQFNKPITLKVVV